MQDLVAIAGPISYDVAVTAEELWRGVAEYLLVERTRRGWNPIDVERNGGPNYATVQEIERGNIRTTDALARHVAAFGFEVSDVIKAVIDRAEGRRPLIPEVARIARKYETTTVEGRQALLQLVQALPDAPEAPTTPGQLPSDLATPVHGSAPPRAAPPRKQPSRPKPRGRARGGDERT